ncbi:hypothetical protein NH8B_0971 [Pseudogulbenkiania sp. NH8B]|uniref:hypothetical protein n=1 Tax=Pseudogulbenkiania sp. (strain NH8B) TaxID=748280 RepID=UPI0002279A89|nr:hypothetical protein [Pseudogulbenkiania sp. NH8B]BAK75803.1 hypothetical protein NH8B_0971 [Pseudogulbenkiania sp. NH8B]
MVTWQEVSGHVPSDALYLAQLARRGWLAWKEREEARLRRCHGDEYMKAVGLALKAHGFDLVPFVRPMRRNWEGR